MTSPSFALVFALAAAPLAAGCRTARGTEASAGALPAASWVAVDPTVAEAELGNGVKVVAQESQVAPLVAIQVWVAAGAADDPPDLAGAAHLFEHLVLRGGKRWGPGGGVREIEAVKGSVDAWTGLDETVYQVVVAAPFFDLGLDVLADAIANPNFDPGEVERARKLALDEIAGAEADARRRATQAVFAAAFAGHAYARPVMGTAASVAALPAARLAGRFAETHTGRALTVVVVGDVAGKNATGAVGRAFAAIPGGRPLERARGALRAAAPSVTVTSAGIQPPEIVVAFRAGELSVDQAAALDLMAAVLAGGNGSRMPRELVRNRQLADGVHPLSFRSRQGGLWAFAVTPAPQRIAEAAEAAVRLVLELGRVPASADEIESARAALERDLARAGDGAPARARRLGFERVIARDARDRERYLEVIRTLTPGALRDAVAPFLDQRGLAIAVALPQGRPGGRDDNPAALKPRLEAALRAEAGRGQPQGVPAVAGGDAVRAVTAGGVRVLVVRDVTSPLVSVEAAWLDRGETGVSPPPPPPPPDDAAPLIAGLLGRGTRTRSASDVAGEMQALGGTLTGFTAPGTLGLRAVFFPRHLERGLGLVADTLLYPAFAESEMDAQARALAARRRAEASEAGARGALSLFQETVSPGARRADPEPPPALTRLGLLDRYRRRYPPSGLVVAIVGAVDPAQAVAAVANAFPVPPSAVPPSVAQASATPASATPASATPPSGSPLPPLRGEGQGEGSPTTVFRTTPTATEANAVVGYPTFPPNDPSRAAVDVFADVLAGEGRLAAALRDDRTAGCRAALRAGAPAAAGYLAVAVSCPPAALDGAVAAVRAELARVAGQGVTPDEVSRATRRLTGARAATLRTGMAVAHALATDEAQGLPMLSYRRSAAALAAVTAADVTRVARAVIDPKREVIAIVRPPSAAPAPAPARTAANADKKSDRKRRAD